jgi:hypothetical protein
MTAAKSAEAAAKLAEAQRSGGKPVDWTLEETCAIIETGMGKNAADLYRMSARPQAAQSIAEIVRETMTAMLPTIIAIIKGTIPEQKALALPPANEISERDQLRQIVNQYSSRTGDYSSVWNELYSQYYYRYHRNIRECAKNRKMGILEYAESEGLISDLLSLAISLFGNAA